MKHDLDQLRQKSFEELRNDIAVAQKKLVDVRLSRVSGQGNNVRELAHLKKKLAQLQTLAQAKKA